MRKYIIGRHFIDGEASFEEYERGIDSIKTATDLSKSRGYGFNFGLKLTVAGDKISEDLQERINEETRKLPKDLWLLYDPKSRGPGTSLRQVLFNPSFYDGVVVNFDLDACVIDTEEALERLTDLIQRAEKDNILFTIGPKDIPAVLARYKRNSDLRIIHELFHSLTIGSDKLKVRGEKPENVTPAFAEIGESSSCLYAVSQTNSAYPELNTGVVKATQSANMDGFAADYYIAIKASLIGEIGTGYIKSKENRFYTEKTEEEEFKDVKELISGQTRELRKTDISWFLLQALKKEGNIKKVSDFYPREEAELVRDLMVGAFENVGG